jgi:DNA-directed RNA polymerase beta' subunit
MKRQDSSKIPKRISAIKFSLMAPDEIRRMSAVEVKTADTYKDDGHAYHQGLMDPKMGVIEPGIRCDTCGNKHDDCPSHFGHIQLELPVMHVGFTNLVRNCLKATCNTCNKVLLQEQEGTHPNDNEKSEQDYYRDKVHDIIIKHGVGSTEFKKTIKEIEKLCCHKKRMVCMHCGEEQGKIMLDKPTGFKEKKEDKSEHKLNARDIREWLEGIPNNDLIFIGMDKESSRPEWTIMRVLPVPPITVRPSITLDSGDRSEDDLTHKLVDVLRINQRLRENRDQGAPQLIVEDLWELLQYHITTYFNNQTSGIPPARHRSGRPLKTLTQRLKGKEGRFRSNLSGKRVNFCARSVISPDPCLGINDVGVPRRVAKELTVPVRVTSRNREQLRQMILRGPDVHPGVNYIVRGDSHRVRITDRTKFIWSGFRCHNPECHGGDIERDEPYPGRSPALNSVLPAPNFLPGLEIVEEKIRKTDGTVETIGWKPDLESTILNLRGEDEDGNNLPDGDARAVILHRWEFEHNHPDEEFPEHLQVICPHCGSPHSEETEERTQVEDRLSTIDLDGNPKPGMVVERHLIDGDVTIFNRQPSLHRMSMMVHEVRVMEGKTFRFNLAVCTPYNADFDGDEMNLHVIQSEEARAEAKILMRVQEHILSPRYGGSVIGGIHDHITGAFLVTHGDRIIPKHLAMQVLGTIDWTGELPKPVKDDDGVAGYMGRELLNLLIPAGVSLRFKSRSKEDVVVIDGNIVSGTIDKNGIGAEDGRLLDAVVQTHGSTRGAKFINDMTRFTIAICSVLGFTTGIDDEDLPAEARSQIAQLNVDAKTRVDVELVKFGKGGKGEMLNLKMICDKCDTHAYDSHEVEYDSTTKEMSEGKVVVKPDKCSNRDCEYNQGSKTKSKSVKFVKHAAHGKTQKFTYESRPGRTPLETLEENIMKILDSARSKSGEVAKDFLVGDNAAVMMAVSGARGSMENLSMMAGSIGQTRVRGQRLERGYQDRVLPHFRRMAKGAQEKGFVASSFKRGLEPTEFFMLSISGRESLVDTAVRTSKSGYMQRRLINAMDDLKVHSDEPHSVRNTADRIIQFSYGEDTIDPTRSVKGSAVNIQMVLDNALGGGK